MTISKECPRCGTIDPWSSSQKSLRGTEPKVGWDPRLQEHWCPECAKHYYIIVETPTMAFKQPKLPI